MAADPLPDALAMRAIKYGAASSQERTRVATALASLQRDTQAVLLYEGRADDPAARRLLDQAILQGAAFRVLSLRRMGLEVGPAELTACARAAERAGRFLDARSCYLALDDQAELARLAPHLPPSLRPAPPPPLPPAISTSV